MTGDWLATGFEQRRPRLRAIAYRLLGSLSEADDAVQETWIRASRRGDDAIGNVDGWLTTIVARVALNMLRSRTARREESSGVTLPDPVISADGALSPEDEVLLAESVGLALLVLLETLSPAERLAFVMHDVFAVPFEEIAPMIERTPIAARQLASRGRRRIQGAELEPIEHDRDRQRVVVDAFFAASRAGDFEALLRLLDPEVVLRGDFGPKHPQRSVVIRGARAVVDSALAGAGLPGAVVIPALVNGSAGAVITVGGRPWAIMGFLISNGRVVEIDAIADPPRVERLAASVIPG